MILFGKDFGFCFFGEKKTKTICLQELGIMVSGLMFKVYDIIEAPFVSYGVFLVISYHVCLWWLKMLSSRYHQLFWAACKFIVVSLCLLGGEKRHLIHRGTSFLWIMLPFATFLGYRTNLNFAALFVP